MALCHRVKGTAEDSDVFHSFYPVVFSWLIKRKIAVSGRKRLLNREKGKRFETKPISPRREIVQLCLASARGKSHMEIEGVYFLRALFTCL
jgi:hypothetical protein